jgi:hybrid cluster-associated redox disulfide protein
MQITKDSIVAEILDAKPEAAPLFLEIGMHCLGCPAARQETLAEACAAHEVDADELLRKIQNA